MPAGSRLAMMTSTARLSCVTPAPTSPGAIRRSSRRIGGVRRGRRSRSRMPARRAACSSTASCATPETVTPTASACPALGRYGVSHSSAAIVTTLNRM